MRALLLVLAACAAEPSAAPPAPLATRPVLVPLPVVVAPAREVVAPPLAAGPDRLSPPAGQPRTAAREAILAVHGNAIAALALAEDGRAAISVDSVGAMRLWPALDGRVEPVVVDERQVAHVALGRDGDAFLVAALDRAGGLAFLTVRTSGAIAWRAPIDEPRPFVWVIALTTGFLALTDDQRLAVFTAQGIPNGHLIPAPGERIVGLAHRADHALALIASDGAVHGRWITMAGWGDATPALPIEPSHVVLSPDLSRIAAQHPQQRGVVVVALATGRVVERAAEIESPQPSVFPLAFFDAHALAVVDGMTISTSLDGDLQAPLTTGDASRGDTLEPIAVAGQLIAWGRGASLQLISRAGAHFLGYRLPTPSDARGLAHGAMVTDGVALVRVDDRFAERERYALPDGAAQVTPIDEHRALAFVRTGGSDDDRALVALDLDEPERTTTLVEHALEPLRYEPTTRLYAVATRDHLAVGRYEPGSASFAGPIAIPRDDDGLVFALVDRGDPLVLVVRHAAAKTIAITRLRFDFAAGTATPGTPRVLADSANPVEDLDRLLPPPRATRGTLVASVGDGRLSLRDGATVRWVVPSHGIAQVLWSPRGALIGVGNGVVRIDLATGALVQRHCGWAFGLWDDDPPSHSGETVCDAPVE